MTIGPTRGKRFCPHPKEDRYKIDKTSPRQKTLYICDPCDAIVEENGLICASRGGTSRATDNITLTHTCPRCKKKIWTEKCAICEAAKTKM